MKESKTLQRMVSYGTNPPKSPDKMSAGNRPMHKINWPGSEDPYLLMGKWTNTRNHMTENHQPFSGVL